MTEHAITRWHRILAQRDPRELQSWLDEDAVFFSPVVHTPQRGKALVALYLSAAFQVLFNDTFHYVREIIGPNDAVLEFEVVIDGTSINGVDLIRWNEAGKVVEFKVMIRPLKAINLVHERMASMLQALQPSR
jgi:ketosteroid isomerase-like protein